MLEESNKYLNIKNERRFISNFGVSSILSLELYYILIRIEFECIPKHVFDDFKFHESL